MKKRISADELDALILGAIEPRTKYRVPDVAELVGVGRYTAQVALHRLNEAGKVCAKVVCPTTNLIEYSKSADARELLSHVWSPDDLGVVFQRSGKNID